MANICDLHTHSTYSDGTLSPTELVRLAHAKGISALALCDHNTVAGLPEFLAAAAKYQVEAVPGVEISAEYGEREVHILGLFIKPQHYVTVTEKLKLPLLWKEQSNRDLVEALVAAGLALDYDEIKSKTPDGQVNRAVIAAQMMEKGYCDSVKDGFAKWLARDCGYYHPPKRLEAMDVIRFLKSIGAVAVLAHPFLNLNEQRLRAFLREAIPAGLDAIEVFYSTFTQEQTLLAQRIAEEFGVLYSGGSDFHGENKPDIQLGSGKDNLHMDCSVLKKLSQRQKLL